MAVSERLFDPADPAGGKLFTITGGGITLELIEYGARIRSCLVPDANGVLADVVHGFDTPADYVARGGSTGAICGRYGNRIGYGRFTLDGVTYNVSVNDPPHCLHGGFKQYAKVRWTGEAMPGENAVRFTHLSPDGDEGFPGNLRAEVVYQLGEGGALSIEMSATTDRATYVNLIYHGYWNLGGHAAGSIHDHLMQADAPGYLPKDHVNLPTGEIADVAGTPFDFRRPKPIGRDIAALGAGYDHNLCLEQGGAVRLLDPKSGRALVLTTDQPGVQMFTANAWKGVAGKDGATYDAHGGVAFETQAYPNTPNIPAFEPVPLRPGDTYRHRMDITFRALEPGGYEGFFAR